MSSPAPETTAAQTVERLVLYIEAALDLARAAGEREVAERLAAVHARLLRDGLRPVPESALF